MTIKDDLVVFGSTKTYTAATGLSCCFRQWRADSHCNQLHGYALQFKVTFKAKWLDERNWAVDFGSLKPFKQWLELMFDHTMCVAKDDPEMALFEDMDKRKIIDIRKVDAVGCEAFAHMAYQRLKEIVASLYGDRIYVYEVECREHDGNSAFVRNYYVG